MMEFRVQITVSVLTAWVLASVGSALWLGGNAFAWAIMAAPIAVMALIDLGAALIAAPFIAAHIIVSACLSVLAPALLATVAGLPWSLMLLPSALLSNPAAVLFALAMFAFRLRRRPAAGTPYRTAAIGLALLLAILFAASFLKSLHNLSMS